MIVMGASLGGAIAVRDLLEQLPASFAPPVIVVLHRHRESEADLARYLQGNGALRVIEPCDKEPIESSTVYLAPPDYHLLIDEDRLSLTIDEPVRYARPCIDVLFESAAACGGRTIAIVLTGGGCDGASGAAAIEAAGGRVIVADPDEALSPSMPRAAIAATRHAEVLQIESIGRRLLELTR